MIEQGSPEWFAQRIGRVTASRICDVVAKTRSGWGASRANYMAQIITERLTGRPTESYTNAAMQHGIDCEPQARAAYMRETLVLVTKAEFVPHPKIAMSGASPDGYVGSDGLFEAKCPQTATHIETLLGQAVPAKYIAQMQWQMACTGRAWVDFCSFDPRLPEPMQLYIQRVPRDNHFIGETEALVIAFLAEVETKLVALKKRYPLVAEAVAA